MNLLTAVVTKVLDAPKYYRHESTEWWIVEVEFECYGDKSKRNLYFKTREEADACQVGHQFLT